MQTFQTQESRNRVQEEVDLEQRKAFSQKLKEKKNYIPIVLQKDQNSELEEYPKQL